MAVHCTAAERGGLIKNKKERKKESLWVKLKAFPTNVGRRNYYYCVPNCVVRASHVNGVLSFFV